jgi:diguanylate cyclase (GGDEF)-like protein
MSVIPLLAVVYLVINYIFPQLNRYAEISAVVLLSVFIALLGFLFAKRLVSPVAEMAAAAQMIADGHYERRIKVSGEDEIAQLGASINLMTSKIRANIEEIKSYSQKAKELNVEIHKRMLVLSSLLQVSDIILTSAVEFKEFLELAISKVAEIYDTGFAAIFLLKDSPGIFFPVAACNLEHEGFDQIAIREGEGLLGKHLFARSTLVVDASAKETKELEAFKRAHNVKSLVGFPIFSGKETFGMLIVGNRIDEYAFSSDEIAIVNNKLVKKTKELALKDDLTDLFSKNYILPRLDEEIKRSRFYQRPCSFVVINVDDYRVFRDLYGEIASEEALKRIASVVRGYMEPFGKAARIAGDEFALLLPEKNKREALEIAEVIRRKVESITFVDSQKKPLTVSIGVSENPIDGSTHEEVLKSARDFLVKAKEQGKNKVVGY